MRRSFPTKLKKGFYTKCTEFKKSVYNPMQIAKFDYAKIDFKKMATDINDFSTCIHKENEVDYFTMDYRNEGMCIEFSLKECPGQGCVYLTLEAQLKEIEYVVPCPNQLPDFEEIFQKNSSIQQNPSIQQEDPSIQQNQESIKEEEEPIKEEESIVEPIKEEEEKSEIDSDDDKVFDDVKLIL